MNLNIKNFDNAVIDKGYFLVIFFYDKYRCYAQMIDKHE